MLCIPAGERPQKTIGTEPVLYPFIRTGKKKQHVRLCRIHKYTIVAVLTTIAALGVVENSRAQNHARTITPPANQEHTADTTQKQDPIKAAFDKMIQMNSSRTQMDSTTATDVVKRADDPNRYTRYGDVLIMGPPQKGEEGYHVESLLPGFRNTPGHKLTFRGYKYGKYGNEMILSYNPTPEGLVQTYCIFHGDSLVKRYGPLPENRRGDPYDSSSLTFWGATMKTVGGKTVLTIGGKDHYVQHQKMEGYVSHQWTEKYISYGVQVVNLFSFMDPSKVVMNQSSGEGARHVLDALALASGKDAVNVDATDIAIPGSETAPTETTILQHIKLTRTGNTAILIADGKAHKVLLADKEGKSWFENTSVGNNYSMNVFGFVYPDKTKAMEWHFTGNRAKTLLKQAGQENHR